MIGSKKVENLVFDNEQIEAGMHELMEWGEAKGYTPGQLCVLMGLLHSYLRQELGLEIKEVNFIKAEADDGVH